MTRAISVLLGLGLLVTTGVAVDFPREFQEHAAVQESLARVHPRARASWLKERGLDDSYYTTFHRPESTGLRCIGRWPWGPSWELAGRDTFLYLGSGSGVRILSIADSVQPRMLGQINARGLVGQVVVQDTLLFVACGSWGAQIYSVSDPANPRELGSMDAVISDICVKDSLCYTTGGDYFRIYNTADPSSPRQLGVVYDTRVLIVLSGSHAFVASNAGMNVYDVSEPSSPQLVNSRGGSYSTLFVRDTLLFCSDAQPSYFAVLDISDPLDIRQVGYMGGYGGHGLYVDNRFAYLSCTYDHQGIFVIDVTNPGNPQRRDSLNPEGTESWDPYVPVSLSYGYLASDNGGLVTVDMHDVSNIGQAWEGYKADRSVDIAVDNGRAYIADYWVGLDIVDVSDPTRPVSLSVYDTSDSRGTNTATARDSFALVGYSGAYGRRSLRVLDVGEPSNPTLVAEDSCYGWPQDFVLRDSLLYVVEAYMFQIFNVARPRDPVRMGSCELPFESYNLDVEGSIAYVANILSLQMINVARPDSPYVVGTWSGKAAGVDVVDTVAYAGSIDYFLASLNVKNPAAPQEIDTLNLDDAPTDVRVVGSRAYVSGGSNWIKVVDVSDPAALKLEGTWSGPGWVRRIEYAAPYLYAACSEAGACVLESIAVGVGEQRARAPWLAGLSFAPNPTRGRVEVGLPTGLDGRCEWEVCNVAGRVVNAGERRTSGPTLRLNLRNEPAGVYVVTCRTPSGAGRGRIVKF